MGNSLPSSPDRDPEAEPPDREFGGIEQGACLTWITWLGFGRDTMDRMGQAGRSELGQSGSSTIRYPAYTNGHAPTTNRQWTYGDLPTTEGLSGRGHQMDSSARALTELNIQHFRRLLVFETDNARRRTICELLAEQEAKIDTLPCCGAIQTNLS